MKYKKYPFILLFVLSSFSVYANLKISGKVVDAITNEPLIGATIFVQETKQGVISAVDGSFQLEFLAENNHLKVSYIGYAEKIVAANGLSGSSVKSNLISLVPLAVGLEEVLVQANMKTSTQKIDRQSYRASDFQTAEGGSATDLLSKLPSVSVDLDGTVSVRGTSDFMVYLNGKPTQIDPTVLLGQISSNQIDNIEVISVPTSNYDAQGKGGIINIVTKRTGVEGLTVTTNGLIGGSPWNNLTDEFSGFKLNNNRYGGGVNVMYFKNNMSLFGGLNFNRRNVNGSRTGDARILVDEGVYRHMVAGGERPEWYQSGTANLDVEYVLSDKTTLSGSYFFGTRKEGRGAYYLYNNYFADIKKQTISGIDRDDRWIYNPNSDNRLGQFQSGNIDLHHQFNKSSDLKVSALYEHSNLKRQLINENYSYNNTTKTIGAKELEFQQSDDTPLDGVRLSVDYTSKFADGSKIEIGFQPQYMQISGGFNYDTLNLATNIMEPYTALENEIALTRGIYAGYVSYTGSINKLNYIAGLRMEYTDQEVNILSDDYFSLFDGEKKSNYQTNKFDLFHTLHVRWDPTEKDNFTFATSRRVSRPQLKNMTPFLYRRHLEVYEVGDPELQPEYLLNLELSYGRRLGNHNLGLTGFYRGVDNAVFRVNTVTNQNEKVMAVTNEDVLIRSFTNAGNSQSLGAELNANIDGGKYAKFFIGGSLYHYTIKGDIFGYLVDNSSLNWSVKSNMNLTLSKELRFALDFNLKSATITAQGQNDLIYLTNAAFNYSPGKLKGWEFSLRVLDLMGSNVQGLDTRAFNQVGEEIFYQETDYFRKGGIVEIGVNYAFNNKGKSTKKSDSTFGKEQF
ncbi:MAG: TonB-dependent receptor [Paludibacter sp.]|nr:TonB-dependent receptor [Paludibacter sp.]